jgi:hypothetical protein
MAVEPIGFLHMGAHGVGGAIMRSRSPVSTWLSGALQSTARALSQPLPSTWLV